MAPETLRTSPVGMEVSSTGLGGMGGHIENLRPQRATTLLAAQRNFDIIPIEDRVEICKDLNPCMKATGREEAQLGIMPTSTDANHASHIFVSKSLMIADILNASATISKVPVGLSMPC